MSARSLSPEQRKLLRSLPRIDELLALPVAREAAARFSPHEVGAAARSVVESARQRILAGEALEVHIQEGATAWTSRLEEALAKKARRLLQPLINATGVVLHTNLGRAPLSEAATKAVAAVARGYSNLEYDVERGVRGSRHDHGEALLVDLCGAEAAMVVNNNAAAVLLVLSALAGGREVVLSRGEMIEIGGAFRIPDVLAQSGAHLVEVGTTNRTHVRDYESAIGPETAALLKVHTSNYQVTGFTHSVSARDLADLARARGVYLLEDLGSGVFVRTEAYGLRHEPTVQEAVSSGTDIVTFSGDKLLGGPQVGIIVGRRDLVEQCRRHPLARAVRVDKMALAALHATLQAYARGNPEEIPIWSMMGWELEALRERAEGVASRIQDAVGAEAAAWSDVDVAIESSRSEIGGGSLPGETLPTWVVALKPAQGASWTLASLAEQLRRQEPAVVGRIEDGRLLLDPRTVFPREDEALVLSVQAALTALHQRVTPGPGGRTWPQGGDDACT